MAASPAGPATTTFAPTEPSRCSGLGGWAKPRQRGAMAACHADGDRQSSASPQPETAERYWRLAAYGGDAYAQVDFADRLRRGFLLVKQEYGSREAVESARARDEPGIARRPRSRLRRSGARRTRKEKSPVEAMKLAYRAIELAVQNDALAAASASRFPKWRPPICWSKWPRAAKRSMRRVGPLLTQRRSRPAGKLLRRRRSRHAASQDSPSDRPAAVRSRAPL